MGVNGWYRRREAAEGPPRASPVTSRSPESWARSTAGRPWFEKDDGCYIRWSSRNATWWLWNALPSGRDRPLPFSDRSLFPECYIIYKARVISVLPPTDRWRTSGYVAGPVPTLRVVS